jgi:hypothetical protein
MPKPHRRAGHLHRGPAAPPKPEDRTSRGPVHHPRLGLLGLLLPRGLEAAADKVIPAGTHMYFDHPTETEPHDRPGRSVKDLAAVVVEAAREHGHRRRAALAWSASPSRSYPPGSSRSRRSQHNIGVSIRGSATDIVVGEAEGAPARSSRASPTIKSVDFVTRAGRGGKVLQVLESAPLAGHRARSPTASPRPPSTTPARQLQTRAPRRPTAARRPTCGSATSTTPRSGSRSRTNDGSGHLQQAYTVADDDMSVP